MNHSKRYLFALLPIALILYAASFGPALRLTEEGKLGKQRLATFYWPFLTKGWPRQCIVPYARLWSHAEPGLVPIQWKPRYSKEEVAAFLKPGISRGAIVQRFGPPTGVIRESALEDGSKPYDETLDYVAFPPGNRLENFAFVGFSAHLKDGRLVDWSPIDIGR